MMMAEAAVQNLENPKIGDRVPGDWKPTPKGLAHLLATLSSIDMVELHSIDPWWLMQCKANSEAIACRSLKREGFEPWFPTFRQYRPMPRKKIASNMRHKKRHVVAMRKVPLYAGYVLIRPLSPDLRHYDVARLYELDGCGGLCTWVTRGPRNQDILTPITIADFNVERMRRAEAAGLNDTVIGLSEHAVMTSIVKEVASSRVMQTHGKTIARLDESLRSSLWIDRGDRVIRVVSTRADAEAVSP